MDIYVVKTKNFYFKIEQFLIFFETVLKNTLNKSCSFNLFDNILRINITEISDILKKWQEETTTFCKPICTKSDNSKILPET